MPDTLPSINPDTDWRSFRAKLVNRTSNTTGDVWAHSLPHPEKGCLLLSHPIMFTHSQTYFYQAVILVWAHDETGSAGLILNAPTQHTVGSVHGAELLRPELSSCPLYLGGDVGRHTLHLLHGISGLQDSIEVLPGVHLGGFEGTQHALASGKHSAQDLKVFNRYCGWGPGQLEEEVKRGVWFPAAASKSVVLQQASLGSGGELWHAVMQLLGPEYADLSAAVRKSNLLLDEEGCDSATSSDQSHRNNSSTLDDPRQSDCRDGDGI